MFHNGTALMRLEISGWILVLHLDYHDFIVKGFETYFGSGWIILISELFAKFVCNLSKVILVVII